MDSSSNTANAARCCGNCRNTIKMREDLNVLLCPAILDTVAADGFACEHYEERSQAAQIKRTSLVYRT
jgi:hypothetical protein